MQVQPSNTAGRVCPRGSGYYMWRDGDTLQSVALANETTVQAMMLVNPDVNFSALSPGAEICLPSRAYTCLSGMPYTVQRGDTFGAIARRTGISEWELSERNPGVNASDLRVGQILCVPADAADPPVLDGTGNDLNTVPPQVQQPVFSCPAGSSARTVQRGQTYADLLIDLNVSYQAMRAANPHLTPGRMTAGTPYCAPPAGTRQSCTQAHAYTILPGETLGSLAQRLRTTQGRLLMLNPSLLPTDFTAGTVICIP